MGYNIRQIGQFLRLKEDCIGVLKNANLSCFEINYNKSDGSFKSLYFVGEKGGWGEKEELDSIASFFEDYSYIEFMGEDGALWRYVFIGGECKEEIPKIHWPSNI